MAMQHVPDLKIISTSWSPPVWLKTKRKINSGTLTGGVTERAYKTYADYLIR